jgi:hypothetical protein
VRGGAFEVALPPLPAGSYCLYADVTHETGFAQTLTTNIDLPEVQSNTALIDPDDSWFTGKKLRVLTNTFQCSSNISMVWIGPRTVQPNKEITLEFRVLNEQGKPAKLEPFLGMQAHAVLRHEDGSVFTHIHPFGTISMASQQLFVKREQAVSPNLKTLDVVCGVPGTDERISFPYEFPKPGKYRIWLQVRAHAEIFTGYFDAVVAAPAT